ncbi:MULTISPECIES: hypothetical protein [unclassified Curtobacterium]|uniref:hypothetical protein n=1 Tax=unclassified Curtobacterium TaxID=257496 RepID=UPI000F49EF34|nr:MULTISPECIES: hypothetical protein [unclassified Curtobacterium]MBF4602683.1 hypothetical protein [Curtobacterium sp. VKM Ac-2884]ROS47335.1 hypothetical protein EDF53_0356 [Curtobacterium sp. PhB78]
MDVVSAKVLGTLALLGGAVFVVTSVVRIVRADSDVALILLNALYGILLLIVGVMLWRFARRSAKRDR